MWHEIVTTNLKAAAHVPHARTPGLLTILWPLLHARAVPPWLRVVRAATAAGFFASAGRGGPTYLLEQRAGTDDLLGRGRRQRQQRRRPGGAWRCMALVASGRATSAPSAASRTC